MIPADLSALIEPVALHLLGEPNRKCSTKTEWRYGSRGSFCIDLDKGTFFDNEAAKGGGVLDLIERETGKTGPDRMIWLEDNHFIDRRPNGDGRKPKIVKTYDYLDEGGVLLFQVCRQEPKNFLQRKPDPARPGEWIWKVQGVRQVPYRLPELAEALGMGKPVVVVEGEKDADRLCGLGIPATTNAGGAGKWREALTDFFAGADVVIIPDNDPQKKHEKTGEPMFHPDGRPILTGQDHAEAVACALSGVAAKVRVLDLSKFWRDMPLKGDVSDWLDNGRTADALYEIVDGLPPWSPAAKRHNGDAGQWEPDGGPRDDAPPHGEAVKPLPKLVPIRIAAGEIERIVDETELALIKAGRGLYQRDGKIVFVSYSPARTSKGEDTLTIQIIERGEHALLLDMSAAANFEKFDKRANKWVSADPSMTIVLALQQHGLGKLRFPVLHGVVTAPTMRSDGSLLSMPGHDAATGLLFDPRGAVFPKIPDRPTRADAESAFALLNGLIGTFPFETKNDRAVALSAILTACVRRSLPTAPLHAISAPTAGNGKGKLVDIACVIATGFKASPIGQRTVEDELEKAIAAKLMTGAPFIAIDNCTQPLSGDLLNSMLTQEEVSPRILGQSKAPSVSTGAFVTATGNGLVIKGDLIRRTLLCRIDAKVEQPENRAFKFDPVMEAVERRPAFVVAALTILRAYHVAGRPGRPTPLGSFEVWSDLVRGAIIWVGAADPVETMNQLRKSDPELEALRSVMGQWREAFGIFESATAAEAIREATKQDVTGKLVQPDFRDALMIVAGRGGQISSRALGHWLQSKAGRIVGIGDEEPRPKFYFERSGERQGAALWALRLAEGPAEGVTSVSSVSSVTSF
jgi:putative DNA primase/helicase